MLKKKVLSSILTISIIASSSTVVIADDDVKKSELQNYIESVNSEDIIQAKMVFENDKAEIVYEYAEVIDEMVKCENDGKMEYEKQYGGAYVNSDNELVVKLTGKKNVDEFQKMGIEVEYVDTSLNELNSEKDLITNKIAKLNENKECEEKYFVENIVGVGISEENNYIFVQMKEVNNKNIKWFQANISDSDNLIFEQEDMLVETTTMKCGQYISINGGAYSFGYRGKDQSGNKGFVSAGHGVSKNEKVYNNAAKSVYLGKVTNVNISNVDACFIKKTSDSDVKLSNSMKYYVHSSDKLEDGKLITAIPEGYWIYKTGYTTKLTYGKVLSASYTAVYGGKTIKDTVYTDAYASGGDSGGTVFAYVDGVPVVLGIVAAGTSGTGETRMVCVKALNIYTSMGIWPY